MKTIFKIIIIFLVISVASTILYNYTDIIFGTSDFFSKHGWIFLFSIAIFPRLTLLVSGALIGSIEFGGLLWWLGFFFAPRILVATLATIAYWNSNQILVVFAWLIALGGESSEKLVISRKMKNAPHRFNNFEGTTIDAEYKVKE
ncbi:MAG: hypothetical protein Q7U04_05750 [Bacteriovorax sp.]|nr:hypothetical protein [Bacteriovorax sp.]